MNLCGRNVAFPVREGMNLIESERMDKKSRWIEFELKTPEKGKKKWYARRDSNARPSTPEADALSS